MKVQDRILGLDVGRKTIGVALSDPSKTIATPFGLIKRSGLEKDFSELKKIILTENCYEVVAGLPISMDGSESGMSEYVRQFSHQFEGFLKANNPDSTIKVIFWDERLSTAAAFRPMIDAGLSFKKRAESKDKMAAAFILQGYLDFKKNQISSS